MGAEAIAKYEAWVNSLPPFERDSPYLSFGGRFWTPNQVLAEMKAGTPTGKKLQEAEEKAMGLT